VRQACLAWHQPFDRRSDLIGHDIADPVVAIAVEDVERRLRKLRVDEAADGDAVACAAS